MNVGAPTDRCATGPSETKRCAAGEGAAPLASIWAFTPPASGIFPALKPGDANPPREVYARGLRNSMALALGPDFPAQGSAFLQGENARDLPDLFEPNEELNAVEKGKHYGWPYCYDLATISPEYRAFLQTRTEYQNLCTGAAIYKRPHSLMPPHAAPLAMLYYQGEKFPELKGKLLVGLHGYRPTGSRIVFYDVDAKGFPAVSAAPVTYNVSCAAEPTRAFQTEQGAVAAAPVNELIVGWHRVNGVRPQGAPVGITVAADGALWLVEDKNQTIIRIDVAPQAGGRSAPVRGQDRGADRRDHRFRRQERRQPQAPDPGPHPTDRKALLRLPFRFRPQGRDDRCAEGHRRIAFPAGSGRLDLSREIPIPATCTAAYGERVRRW